ncbi:hypothetical protein [Paenibacillus ehimensis]|uniref:SAF domain-containing protein n=1 Tax=Paenibacillus ehimensis TaxID=79264 RepID=A0ABT8VKY4_9BACL|nr:hypothetical protein [Paenibacillus ehimensis]MDO3681648.1 hypothetical protein [Paenibacillus ehimensis]MEC0211423.1 hypothetical protein [Paenibacillus ehimensis]
MQKAWIVITLGCVLMAGSIYGYWQFMKHTEIQVRTMTTVKPVRMLQSGEVIEASMLRKAVIPLAAHSSEAVMEPEALIGKTVLVPIADSEELVSWKLTDRSTVPRAGERYFSFKTDAAVNVNNMVRRGDRVDVWVEFETPKFVTTGSGALWSVGAVKIIEQLPVTAVKTAEGLEVTDGATIETVVQPNQIQWQNARSKPNGKPELNTYIMNDEVYEAYVLGSIGGKIKLALPDLSAPAAASGTVTGLFQELKEADLFSKTKPQVQVKGELNRSQVSGKEKEPAAAQGSGSASSGLKATEVKPAS